MDTYLNVRHIPYIDTFTSCGNMLEKVDIIISITGDVED